LIFDTMKTPTRKTPLRPSTKTVGQSAANQKSEIKNQKYRTVLLAVSGMSPAIITETVWALAQQQEPPIIPDEIRVITTRRGESDLTQELFTPLADWGNRDVWQTLRADLLAPGDGLLEFKPRQIFTINDSATGRSRELDDIRTEQENAAAAELILDEVRRLTANDDTRIIASLAGGRKTMGALLHAAISLLGRRQDRLTHILVNEPFDNPALRPKFYFPGQPGPTHQLPTPNGPPVQASGADARPQLAYVPFVPLHYLFKEYLGRLPGGFAELVRTASGVLDELTAPVHIELDPRQWKAAFDGSPVALSGRDIPFFHFLCERARSGQPPFATHKDAADAFVEFLKSWCESHDSVNLQFAGTDWRKNPPSAEDLRKRVGSLRSRVIEAGLGRLIPVLFPVRGALGFPPDRVRIEP
jgi:CRISPR-associated protein (TIGR02584 family)